MLIELLGHGGMSQYYRQDEQPLGLRHRDTVNATVLQSVTIMQQTNQTILTLARPIGGAEGTNRDASALGVLRLCVRSDDYLFLLFTFSFISLCTILRPQDMTPGITCDSKSPMTDRPGPLVRPRVPVRYSIRFMRMAQPLVGL